MSFEVEHRASKGSDRVRAVAPHVKVRDDGSALLTGWGRTAPSRAAVVGIAPRADALTFIEQSCPERGGASSRARGVIARGLGRAYNDSAQNAGGVVAILDDAGAEIAIDPGTGLASVRAGTSLGQLIEAAVPLGWFVPISPGTRHVTMGGAIAADAHGKNHHRLGSIGSHVASIELDSPSGARHLTPDSSSAETVSEFWATVGGMGLTGVIRAATLQLIPVETRLMRVDTHRVANLDDLLALLAEDESHYSVAWVDALARGASLGRAVVTSGDHATRLDLPSGAVDDGRPYSFAKAVPLPHFAVNSVRPSVTRAFNELWFRKAPRRRVGELQSIASYFHPLDGLANWNRLYGRAGFLQWQCVVPLGAERVVQRVLERFSNEGLAAPVVVLKRLGAASLGPLSFAMPGWTLSVDVAAGANGAPELLDELDEAVVNAHGRLYLAKDSRMRAVHLSAMYPRLEEWRAVRDALDPNQVMQSDLARRLDLCGRVDHTRAQGLRGLDRALGVPK